MPITINKRTSLQEVDIHRAIALLYYIEGRQNNLKDKSVRDVENLLADFADISTSSRNTFKVLEDSGIINRKTWEISNENIKEKIQEKQLMKVWSDLKNLLYPG